MNKSAASVLILMSTLLLACGSGTATQDGFFKVNYYSDFDAIDYSAPITPTVQDLEHPTRSDITSLVGHDYVRYDKKATYNDDKCYGASADSNYDYKSKQTAVTGYEWNFKGWKGTYSEDLLDSANYKDGETMPNAGDVVDLSHVKASCNVFAYYVLEIQTFKVRLYNFDNTLIKEVVGEYQSPSSEDNIGTLAGTIEDPSHNTAGLDNYYEIYSFLGWQKKDSTDPLISTADLLALKLNENADYVATYSAPSNKSFEVTYLNDDDSLIKTETIAYGEAATFVPDEKPCSVPGKKYSFNGWVGTYAADAPSVVASKRVDANHIKYDCTVKASFVETAIDYSVKYYNEDGSLLIFTDPVNYGQSSSYEGATPSKSGYTFIGWTTAPNGGGELADFSNITDNLNVYAAYAENEFTSSGIKYEYQDGGYVLVEADSVTSFGASDVSNAHFTTLTPLTKVAKLAFSKSKTTLTSFDASSSSLLLIDEAAFKECSALTSISLPASLTSIGREAFAYSGLSSSLTIPGACREIASGAFALTSLTDVVIAEGVESIGSDCFKGVSTLASVSIPSTVTYVGADAFYGDTSATINIALSSVPSTWDASWNRNGGTVNTL